jgi:ATP-dependent RNA helicase RhlE
MLKEIQRMTGTVKWYDEKKGYGFIISDRTGEDVFLHSTALLSKEYLNIATGDRFTFQIQNQKKGLVALEVKHFSDESEVTQSDQEVGISENSSKIDRKIDDKISKAFTDLGLNPELLRAISDAGYIDPTPIQARAIPLVLKGHDVLGCAQTGTGKTAAFALPTMQRLGSPSDTPNRSNRGNSTKNKMKRQIRILVLAPTRELAIQIDDSFSIYGKYTGLKSTVIYGGVGQNPQVQQLTQGVDIVVATPGRLIDLMEQGYINLNQVEVLILDEGDRMLDMGFIHDIRYIVKKTPQKDRQTLLFSATIPREIKELAKDILNNPIEINISPEQPTLEIIDQAVYFISRNKKQALLQYLLKDSTITRALVFTRTKHSANRVVKNLQKKGIRADAIHGNKSQTARQTALKNFRIGKTHVLVATDVASRGLDVDDISHIIQFDLPDVPETYLHRIGRTARAGAGGTAFAFCEEDEHQKLKDIEKLIRTRVKRINNHPYIA